MTATLRAVVAPAYLFLCLILGGSAQGIWGNFILHTVGLGIVTAAIWSRSRAKKRMDRALMLIVAGLILWILVQLVPLPPTIWQIVPGRAFVADGDRLLGLGDVWRPISLSPFDTLAVLPTMIPPIAMMVAVFRFGDGSGKSMAIAIALAAMAGTILGVAQSGGHDGRFYLYPVSNFGVPTGFFANGNHMASLLLCLIPFAAALVEQGETQDQPTQKRWTASLLAAGLAAVAVTGLALNRSLFGLALVVPVTLASLLIAFRHRIGRPGRLIAGTALLVLAVGLVAGSAAFTVRGASNDLSVSLATRSAMAKNSLTLLREHGALGTGAGSFASIYATVEDPAAVDQVFVNHAHNDYLEWAVEGGVPGLILLLAFLIWWGRRAKAMLQDRRADGFAQAGMIAALILLLHSAVDFPLRTAALASLFAAATAVMIVSRRLPKERPELRPSRHLTIG